MICLRAELSLISASPSRTLGPPSVHLPTLSPIYLFSSCDGSTRHAFPFWGRERIDYSCDHRPCVYCLGERGSQTGLVTLALSLPLRVKY